MPAKLLKRGRLSQVEKGFILEHAGKMSDEDIAKKLQRTPEMIKKFREEHVLVPSPEDGTQTREFLELKKRLHSRYYWETLQKQFSDDELRYFTARWIEFIEQFNNDVLPTEESQICDLIKLEILQNRNLVERNDSMHQLDELRKEIDVFQRLNGPPPYSDSALKAEFMSLQSAINQYDQSYKSRTDEYTKLQDRCDSLRNGLRATREQRVKVLTETKKSLQQFIKDLLDSGYRQQIGKQLAMIQEATKRERKRLESLHKYEDGQIDIPILNSDSHKRVKL